MEMMKKVRDVGGEERRGGDWHGGDGRQREEEKGWVNGPGIGRDRACLTTVTPVNGREAPEKPGHCSTELQNLGEWLIPVLGRRRRNAGHSACSHCPSHFRELPCCHATASQSQKENP